jgi:hypothetical protein
MRGREGSSLHLTLSNLRMDDQVNQEQTRPLVSRRCRIELKDDQETQNR